MYAPRPKFWGVFESALHSGTEELQSPASGTVGYKSPFCGTRTKLTSYLESTYQILHFSHFLVLADIFGTIYRTEATTGWKSNPSPSRNIVRFGKMTRDYLGVPRSVWSGVSVTGYSNLKLVHVLTCILDVDHNSMNSCSIAIRA